MKGKKYLRFFIVLLVIFTSIFSGCSKSNNIVAEAISVNYEHNYVEARVGDVICSEINDFYVVSNKENVKTVFSSSNPTIASVSALTGVVNCLKVGTVTIYGYVKKDDNTMVGDSFTLVIKEKLYFASGFTLQNEDEITLGLEDNNVFNEITYDGQNVNVFPTVSYSNSKVASYNYETGQIVPHQIGTTTIYVTLQLENETITKQFTIKVVQKMMYIDVETTFEMQKNKLNYITFNIIDNTQKTSLSKVQRVNIEVLTNANLIEIIQNDFQAILIQTKSEGGTVILRLTYVSDESITKTIGITIN